ncbi:zinc finger protein JACKDAW-like [Aristolochia californica]|uniref:zinc finger protein JACKDAW-like n=1 Tax=Aristolochia californica TaxID=171875 RepID=UPI0035D86AC9
MSTDHPLGVPSSFQMFTQDPNPNPNSGGNSQQPQPVATKKKRNLPGTPDPDAEVIALSPKTLMATNRFVCEICNKGFQRDQNLQLHRRGHNLPWKLRQRTSKEVRKRVYVCPEKSCVHHDPSRALGDLTGIKKHFSRKHGEKKWKCDKCSKKYAVQSDWKAHVKTCGTREYKCDCGTIFSRLDSFITHRAFCDALTEESARLSSGSPNNPHLLQSQPGLSPLASDPAKPSFSLLLDRANYRPHTMDMTANSHTLLTSTSMGTVTQVGSDNLFASIPAAEFGGWPMAKGEGGGSSKGQMVESFGSLYSDKQSQQQNQHSAHMSATALLQKAAQMGATTSGPSLFSGFRVGPSSSSSSAEAPRGNDRSQLLIQGRTQENLNSFTNSISAIGPIIGNEGLTRDFLGVGPADGTGRSFLRQEVANYASVGSVMNVAPYHVNH